MVGCLQRYILRHNQLQRDRAGLVRGGLGSCAGRNGISLGFELFSIGRASPSRSDGLVGLVMDAEVDSSEGKGGEHGLFALGFLGLLMGSGGIIASWVSLAATGAVMLLLSVLAFR